MGTLYIVSTPIGNLKDITFRAIEILKSVDYILCEDTRISGKLLKHYEINSRLVKFADFNEEKIIPAVVSDLTRGQKIALVSDAGTPLISDPGFKLVRQVTESGIKVESIPGASATLSALVISGLPTDKFLFLGYLSKKDSKRLKMLEDVRSALKIFKTTIIIYESPYRVLKTLRDVRVVFGDVTIAVCRELTKLYEETFRGTVSEALDYFTKKAAKGEFVILF